MIRDSKFFNGLKKYNGGLVTFTNNSYGITGISDVIDNITIKNGLLVNLLHYNFIRVF